MTKEAACQALDAAMAELTIVQQQLAIVQTKLAATCKDVYGALNDREMAEQTGYSRARIQQFRCGDPKR